MCGRNGGKPPLILETNTRQRWVFSFDPFRIINLEETVGWVAHKVRQDVSEKRKRFAPTEIRTPDLPDRILVTTLTELFRLPTRPFHIKKY
jgi:hypothetical protein